jgi:ribosomal protein S18 acetylase RimI-like enzyme
LAAQVEEQLMAITIRPLTVHDAPILWEMLYHALHVPPGDQALPCDIVNHPSLSRYVTDWGRADDHGFLAQDGDQPIGAAWLRRLAGANRGYGYIDDDTPELTIAVLPSYRGQGIGTRLLTALLALADDAYQTVSLSVSCDNPARHLYERLGFVTVARDADTVTMRRKRGE